MITLPANFVAAFDRADVRPRFWCEIDDGTNTWQSVSGSMDPSSDLYGTPEGLITVSSVAAEADILTREVTVGEVVAVFEDAFLRPILVNNRLRGQKLTIKVGTAELDSADFVVYFTGAMEEIEPDGQGNTIQVAAMDLFSILKNTEITHTVFNRHPLEHIKLAMNEAGIPDSLIELADFDPSDARYSLISHYVISKNANLYEPGGGPIDTPKPAFDIITEISILLMGQLVARENGKIGYAIYNPAASAVADWDDTTIIADTVQQTTDPLANMVNALHMFFWLDFDEKQVIHWVRHDPQSAADYAYPGTSFRLQWHDIITDWINAWTRFEGDANGLIQPTDTTIVAQGGLLHGFSGTNQSINGGTPPAWATVSASRPLYLYIRDMDRRSLKVPEVVKCTSLVLPANNYAVGSAQNIPSDGTGFGETRFTTHESASFQNLTRGFEGEGYTPGTGNTWGSNRANSGGQQGAAIWDATILFDLSTKLLERFSDGFYNIELETSFLNYAVEVGDVVTLTWPQFVAYGLDGIDTNTTWEVVSKEPDVYADPPRIKWALASIVTRTPVPESWSFDLGTRAQIEGATLDDDATFSPFINNRLPDGTTPDERTTDFQVTAGAGAFDVNIAAGLASDGKRNAVDLRTDVVNFTLPASQDNYIFVDTRTGQINNRFVTTGAAEPLPKSGEAILAFVPTDGSGRVYIQDRRTSGGIRGDRVKDDTISTGQQYNEVGRTSALNLNFNFAQRSRR